MRTAVLLCSSLLLWSASASAATRYVAANGSDSNPGTLASPLRTPTAAVRLSAPGDTVILRGGTYTLTRPLTINVSGLTLTAYRASNGVTENVLLSGATDQTSSLPNMVVIYADRVTIADLAIRGGAYYGVKIDSYYRNPTGIRIQRVRISGTGRDGIKTQNADNLLIEDAEIGPTGVRDASNAEGIDVIGSIGVTIRRCYIHDIPTNGLYLKGGTVNGVVEGCRIERTGYAGLLLGSQTSASYMRNGADHEAIDSVARNNVVVDAAMAGLGTIAGRNVRFENNTLVNVARTAQAGFRAAPNDYDTPATGITLRNNVIVLAAGTRPYLQLFDVDGPIASDDNVWYAGGRAATFYTSFGGTTRTYSTLAGWQNASGADLRSLIVDPRLDAANLSRPVSGSPVIDRAAALTGVTTDHDGTPRPQGSAPDIGAHEYTTATPAAPTGLAALSTRTQVTLAWTDASDIEDGFTLQRSTDGTSFATIATLPAGTRTYTNTGLSAGRLYYYRVRAFNAARSSAFSNTVSIRTLP